MHKHSSRNKMIALRFEVRQVPCPTCNILAGNHCIKKNGNKRYASHQERWDLWRSFKENTDAA